MNFHRLIILDCRNNKENFLKKKTCPICGKGKLTRKKVTEFFKYKGEVLSIPNYEVDVCDFCKEEIVSSDCFKKHEKAIRKFHERVDRKNER